MMHHRRVHAAKERKQHVLVPVLGSVTASYNKCQGSNSYSYNNNTNNSNKNQKRLFGLFVLLSFVLCCGYRWTVSNTSTGKKQQQEIQLPDHLLIGYVDNFEEEAKIVQAVKDGVNVLIWAFFNMNETTGEIEQPKISQVVNIIQNKLPSFNNNGDKLIHLTSFGGWNGPHLPTTYHSSKDLYDAWVRFNIQTAQGVFHGFDWDLEGHDNHEEKTSNLTLDCLQYMIQMTHYAKNDGYIVGMAPPQSYLDVQSDNTTLDLQQQQQLYGGPFSTKLHLPPLLSSTWHPEFHYTGYNSYAPLLLSLHNVIDFISIQFYETWSRATYEINYQNVDPSTYLVQYIEDLVLHRNQGYHVLFPSKYLPYFTNNDNDSNNNQKDMGQPQSSTEQLVSKFIPIPINKLVFGFANGWALSRKDGGALFFDPVEVQKAFETLRHRHYQNQSSLTMIPRGCMFWSIGWEGENGIFLAKGLNEIWKTNKTTTKTIRKKQ